MASSRVDSLAGEDSRSKRRTSSRRDHLSTSTNDDAVRQRRRRRTRQREGARSSSSSSLSGSTTDRGRRIRKPNKLITPKQKSIILCFAVLGMVTFSCFAMFFLLMGGSAINDSNAGTKLYGGRSRLRGILSPRGGNAITINDSSKRENDPASLHADLYEIISKLPEGSHSLEYDRAPYELTSSYSTEIMNKGCSLTVILMDPRLPTLQSNNSAWFSLESIAAYTSDACVLLQTSSCLIHDKIVDDQSGNKKEYAQERVGELLYEKSLPLFRGMIERGQVRVTLLDHKKYNLESCSDFYNPSWAFLNRNYWVDEFIDGVDSDLVLITQADAVLCHQLDPENWRDAAFVGSVWPRKSTRLNPVPVEGMCMGMPAKWHSWTRPQRMWEAQQSGMDNDRERKTKREVPRPKKMLDTNFPSVCEGGNGPVGNGGLSLRSREWMIEAITTCPHIKWSGMDTSKIALACKVIDDANEDFYFGTVLRGLKAPLPTAFEASLFSTEMLFPEEVTSIYGELPAKDKEKYVQQRWGTDSLSMYRLMQDNSFTIPLGMHKPWWYHSDEILLGKETSSYCKLLKYMYQPNDSKHADILSEGNEAPWVGIGN